VNSLGTQYEAMALDRLWNCKWQTATSVGTDTWFVEVAIPFTAFELNTPAPDSLWGYNLNRERRAGGGTELYNWADVQGNFHTPGLFGHLWFVGNEWKPTEENMAAVARRVGGAQARIYTADGYYEVKQGARPKALTYRNLIQLQRGGIEDRLEELRKIYAEQPALAFKDQFDKLRARYDAIKGMASGERAISAEESAGANTFLRDMGDALDEIYWRVRVKMLLETFGKAALEARPATRERRTA
jgi:hypothetical protein